MTLLTSLQLYRTLPDPAAGQEEVFPKPDNFFKLARSNQNAAHIGRSWALRMTAIGSVAYPIHFPGLFSPSRGGPSHLGDRHRHGRFDRGTSFALLERMMAENAMLRGIHGLPAQRRLPYY